MVAEILGSAARLILELGFNILAILNLNDIDNEGRKKGD